MQINGINPTTYTRIAELRAAHGSQKPAATETATVAPVADTTEDGTRGVIRLLQEGHFKGVADVRLRINFHEELQALQGEADGQKSQDVLQMLSIDVKASIEAFLAENPLDEAAQESFSTIRATFELKLEGLVAGDTEGDAAAALSAAFEAFIDEVSALLAPPVEPEVIPIEETEVIPTEEVVEAADEVPQTPLQQLVESLQDLLQATIVNLNNPPSLLPPLSEPNGNGGAFAKFLAMYQELNGIETPETPEPTLNVTL